jgi:hypothetical protein
MAVLHRDTKLKWVARLHFWVMFFSFFFYLGLGLTLGPEFLYQDIRKKLFAFADDTIVVTAVVPGPPAVPVITATPACVGLAPRIALNWADDIGTTTWDIDRDSLPLTTGLTLSQYTDTAVVANTTYSYQITAYGPMFPGSATSASVSATTLDCASVVPVTVSIETLGGKNVRPENRANTDLSKRRPKVTGTTNTPYAIIDITVTNPSIRARITANANGYFEWIPPIGLDTGNHILSVTATDPADSARTGVDSFVFWTKNVSGSRASAETAIASSGRSGTFDFSVRVKNLDRELFQEDILSVDIVAKDGVFPAGVTGRLYLNDPSRQDVFRLFDAAELAGKAEANIEEALPLYLEPGVYRARADIVIDDETVSREDSFTLKGLPLLTIAGREVSYAEAASYIGLLFFSLFFLFLLFLLLFIREYWLYLHSLRAVTERQLAKLGFFGYRKGVIR